MTQDTTLQIADANGQLFCQTIAASNWKHPRVRTYRFRDSHGTFAGGLKRGRFKMQRDGSALFKTKGKRMTLSATDGRDLRVTLRVGDQCAQTTTQLRQKNKALVFP